jgi:hypothetical protein
MPPILNPTRMHVTTHLAPKYEGMRNSQNCWSIQEAGMAQLDDVFGAMMKKLTDLEVDKQHYRSLYDRQRHRGLYLA